MQLNTPLTPTLSPSDGERETIGSRQAWPLTSDGSSDKQRLSLSPSDGGMCLAARSCSADFQSAVSPIFNRQSGATFQRVRSRQRAAECNSAIRRSAVEPHPKRSAPILGAAVSNGRNVS